MEHGVKAKSFTLCPLLYLSLATPPELVDSSSCGAASCSLPPACFFKICNLQFIYLRLRWRKIAEKGGTEKEKGGEIWD